MDYLEINDNIFKEKIEKNWKEIFDDEFKQFGSLFKLFGFLNNNEIIGGFCLGYNPDYFKEEVDNIIIKNLNTQKYQKISYFYIIDKYKGYKQGGKLLLKFMQNNGGKYFLTCDNEILKKYYLGLGFKLINENKNKFILVYEN